MTMHSSAVEVAPRPTTSVSRAIIAGFVALGVSTVTLVIVSGVAGALGEVYRGSGLIFDWMYELTHNPLVELGRGQLFPTLAVHLFFGLFWAVLYALVFEPRLRQYPGWLSGALFSMLPFFLSVIVFLPATRGGLFGSDLHAGPLPLIGNLILHLLYGATLGMGYAAGTDSVSDEDEIDPVRQAVAMNRAETDAARGIIIGALIGGIAGVAIGALGEIEGSPLQFSSGADLVGNWAVAIGVAGALAGGAVGALIGSMAGLTDPGAPSVEVPSDQGEPVAAAFIPLAAIATVATLIVTIGSALLTVGNPEHFGKGGAYNNAIILGLSILAIVTAVATLIDRTGRGRPSGDGH